MASKTILELSATTAPLASDDLIVIEKGDGSGTKKMTYTELINAISNEMVAKAALVNNGNQTAAGYALDARYGKTLADILSARAHVLIAVQASSSTTVALDFSQYTRRILAFAHASNTGLRGLYLLMGANVLPVIEASNLTLSLNSSTGVLTVANTHATNSVNGVII